MAGILSLSSLLLVNNQALAASQDLKDSLEAVYLVRDSCQQLEDLIIRGEYADLKFLVKGLIRNYKLKENMAASVSTIKDDALVRAVLVMVGLGVGAK